MAEWQPIDRDLSSYPIGTRARESWNGCEWVKTARGWKAVLGDTFPRPGGANQVKLPDSASDSCKGSNI